MYNALTGQKVANGTIILVMNGLKDDLTSSGSLPITCGHVCKQSGLSAADREKYCTTVYQCIRKEMFWNTTSRPLPKAFIPTLTSVAMLDFELALHGERFYGNMYSTMSQEIHSQRIAMNKQALFFNVLCTKFPRGRCP